MAHSDIYQKRDSLNHFVNGTIDISIEDFDNWGQTQHRSQVLVCRPVSLEHIQAVVRGCRQLGIRIRAAGAGHSWSPLFSDEGQLVMYTKDLKRHDGPQIELLQDMNDSCDKHVTVMTNVTTGELMEFELSHGVCLPCNVVLKNVTLGGVVATACHGVGRDCRTVSDYVTAMTIVDSDGELRSYRDDEDGYEMMRAVKGSLGLFGIIYDITFKVQPMFTVNTKNCFKSASEVFFNPAAIKELFQNNWSVELFWFPFNSMSLDHVTDVAFWKQFDWNTWEPENDLVWVREINKAETAGDVQKSEIYIWRGVQHFLDHLSGKVLKNFVTTFPRIIPSFVRTEFHALQTQGERERAITELLPLAIHYRDAIDLMPVQDMEWALDCDAGYENFSKATDYVIKKVKSLAIKGQFPLSLVMEIRLMGSTDIYTAPAQAGSPGQGGSGHTLYIEVLSLARTQGWLDFTNDVAQFWKDLPGARPHWAKEWTQVEGIEKYLQKMYSTSFQKFRAQLEISKADPDGIFRNASLDKLIFEKNN